MFRSGGEACLWCQEPFYVGSVDFDPFVRFNEELLVLSSDSTNYCSVHLKYTMMLEPVETQLLGRHGNEHMKAGCSEMVG